MTALERFVRLESGGLWRENKDAQRRDVTVSFGKTTLVLSDSAQRPVAHWSLPAVRRLNPGKHPALFAPDKDADEVLEIEDDLMIDAIEEVRKALRVATPHPGRLRGYLTGGVAAAVVGAAVFLAPGAMRDTAAQVVPSAKQQEIGTAILGHYQRLAGAACNGGPGTAVLEQLHARLFGAEAAGSLVVVPSLPQGAMALPGDLILIDRRLIEGHDGPAPLAGHILAAADPVTADNGAMRALVEAAALSDTMTLLTTGDLPDAALKAHAQMIAEGAFPLDEDRLRATTAIANAAPGARAPQAVPLPASYQGSMQTGGQPLLDDNAWVRLQNICRP